MLAKFRARIHGSYVLMGVALGIIAVTAIIQLWNLTLPIELTGWPWLLLALVLVLVALAGTSPATFLLAVLAGGLIASYRVNLDLLDKRYLESLIGQTVEVGGVIAEDPSTTEIGYALKLVNLRFGSALNVQDFTQSSPETEQKSLSGIVYVQVEDDAFHGESPKRSDIVLLKGELNAGFGTFIGSFYRPEVTGIGRSESGDWLLNLRDTFSEATRKVIESPAVDLGLGYVLGVKSTLPEDLQMTLQTVGLTHIVVASGANLSILVNFARGRIGKISRFAALVAASILVMLFVFMVGFSATMVRAGLVSLLSLFAWFFGRQFMPSRLLILVAAITLLYSPAYILDVGWQLSFAAFTGILVVGPKLTNYFYRGKGSGQLNTRNQHLQKQEKGPNLFAATLIETFAATLLCLPIMAYTFGQFSLISLLANILILPTIPYAMATTFGAGLLALLQVPILTDIVAGVAGAILNFNIATINFFGDQTGFLVALETGQVWVWALYLPIVVMLIWLELQKIYRRRKLNRERAYDIIKT